MSQNQSPKIARSCMITLASTVVMFVLFLSFGYLSLSDDAPLLSSAATEAALYAEEQILETASADSAEQAAQIAALLLPDLQRQLEQLQAHADSTSQAREQQHAQAMQQWRLQIEKQTRQLEQLSASVRTLGKRLAQMQEAPDEMADVVGPEFRFRGIEVWHGRVYALLEHEGRILTAREGDFRLGWRIHGIDREQRRLYVGDGTRELMLEQS